MSRALGGKAMRQRNHRRGLRAEYAALALLMLKGYRLVAMRYKTPVGEIDLIVRRGQYLVCVEVKARPTHAAAAEAIHTTNQSRVVAAAQSFLAKHPAYAYMQVRFDAVLVAWYRLPHHLVHAFGESMC